MLHQFHKAAVGPIPQWTMNMEIEGLNTISHFVLRNSIIALRYIYIRLIDHGHKNQDRDE